MNPDEFITKHQNLVSVVEGRRGDAIYGCFFILLAVVLAAVGSAALWVLLGNVGGGARISASTAKYLLLPLILGLWAAAAALTYYAERWFETGRNKLIRADKRQLTLYLRAFRIDGVEVDSSDRSTSGTSAYYEKFMVQLPEGLENGLTEFLSRIGPPLAIAHPRDDSDEVGALRLRLKSGDWQAVVGDLAASASAIMLRLDETEGVSWELEHILKSVPLERLFIFLARPDGSAMDAATFATYLEKMKPDIRRYFPPAASMENARFIFYGTDGNGYTMTVIAEPQEASSQALGFRRALVRLHVAYGVHLPAPPRYRPRVVQFARLFVLAEIALLSVGVAIARFFV